MRDPARIPRILEALRVEWEKAPDLRLGQLLINAIPSKVDTWDDKDTYLFYVEDEPLVAHVQSFTRPKKSGQ